jgi:membrane protein YdbS with pleckstrin-like domain
MADFMQMVSLFREQMNATLSRSDVLRPLAWLVLITGLTLILLVGANAPEWLLILAGVLFVGSVCIYAVAYIFCLFVDRDSLRSEKYSLQQMAIEHGIVGDSTTGVIELKSDRHKSIGPTGTAESDK